VRTAPHGVLQFTRDAGSGPSSRRGVAAAPGVAYLWRSTSERREGRVLRVGLTGNIASGKSTVARVWERLGATVIDADVLARRAVEPGTPALAAIVREWGGAVLDDTGALDRAALREIVFRDAAARERLEAIVHPAVAALREEEARAA